MKKKVLIAVLVLILAAVLFVPIPGPMYRDGGTRCYMALTYQVVKWRRFLAEDTSDGEIACYQKTSLYLFPNNFKSIDELWELEQARK